MGVLRLNEPVFVAALLFRLTEVGYFEKKITRRENLDLPDMT